MMTRFVISAAGVVAMTFSVSAQAAQVWESTFDSTADGVVDVVDGNLAKTMIGPVSGGKLQITTADVTGAFNDNDRAGRALGSTLNGFDSFSGRYKFNFSDLNEDASPQMWEFVGFIGNDVNSTRQQIGVMLRHNKAGGNYFTSMDLVFGNNGSAAQIFDATGTGGYGPLAPTGIFLGSTNAEGRELQLAIGYDGSTHVLTAELYDENGVLLSGNSRDIDDLLVPVGANTATDAYNGLQVSHLGWADYVATGAGRTTVWQVDSLAYYDDATGAFVPEPSVAAMMALGTLALLHRRRKA